MIKTSQKWIIFFVFIFLSGTIMGLVVDAQQLSDVGLENQSALAKLTAWQQVSSEESWGLLKIVAATKDFFEGLFMALTWQFSFLDNTIGQYIKWLVLGPLLAGFVWGVIITFIGIFQKVLA